MYKLYNWYYNNSYYSIAIIEPVVRTVVLPNHREFQV